MRKCTRHRLNRTSALDQLSLLLCVCERKSRCTVNIELWLTAAVLLWCWYELWLCRSCNCSKLLTTLCTWRGTLKLFTTRCTSATTSRTDSCQRTLLGHQQSAARVKYATSCFSTVLVCNVFSSAFHISWSDAVCLSVCVCVWMLTRLAQIVPSLACTDLLMNPDCTECTPKTTYRVGQKTGLFLEVRNSPIFWHRIAFYIQNCYSIVSRVRLVYCISLYLNILCAVLV